MVKKEAPGHMRRKGDYETTFGSPNGQRVIADLMTTFNWGRSSHTPGDPYETAFREGERHVILHILNTLGKRSDSSWINDKLDTGMVEYSGIQEFA